MGLAPLQVRVDQVLAGEDPPRPLGAAATRPDDPVELFLVLGQPHLGLERPLPVGQLPEPRAGPVLLPLPDGGEGVLDPRVEVVPEAKLSRQEGAVLARLGLMGQGTRFARLFLFGSRGGVFKDVFIPGQNAD